LATRPAASDAGLQQGLAILLNTDCREQLHGLQGSHWLFGGRDTLVPNGVADAIAQLCPSAQITTIVKSGHAPMLSHADEFLAWVLQTYG
jgi:pimeloyl-ACP methyl ester carboxylesterase